MFIIQCPILWYAKVCVLLSARSSFFKVSVQAPVSEKPPNDTHPSSFLLRNSFTHFFFFFTVANFCHHNYGTYKTRLSQMFGLRQEIFHIYKHTCNLSGTTESRTSIVRFENLQKRKQKSNCCHGTLRKTAGSYKWPESSMLYISIGRMTRK